MKSLTDKEFAEQLCASSSGAANESNPEVQHLRSALDSYRTETLQWAERRSAAQPSLAALAQRRERWAALPRWSLATIAMVTIAAGVAHLSEGRSTTADPVATAQVSLPQQARSSAEEIAADNQLLDSINAELSYHTQSPVDGLQLKPSETPATRVNEHADSEE